MGQVANNPKEVRKIAAEFKKPVMLKVQVLAGGRGKAGGIVSAESPEEAERKATLLFSREIGGSKVEKILVEEKLDVVNELYASVTIDEANSAPVLMASSEGGVDIEEVASRNPEKVIYKNVNILHGVKGYEILDLTKKARFPMALQRRTIDIIRKLYRIFKEKECELVEINPLVITSDGNVIAADARLNTVNYALFRHPAFKEIQATRVVVKPLELEGQKRDVFFVELEEDAGNIAVVGNGAGLVMSLLDSVAAVGGRPACFLDTGGGLSTERTKASMELLLMKAEQDPSVKVVFFAFTLMISPAEVVANGIINVLTEKKPKIPFVGTIHGIKEEYAIGLLKKIGVLIYPSIEEAVTAAVEMAKVETAVK
jgi:succinyl-CoA synthetase beta subunit